MMPPTQLSQEVDYAMMQRAEWIAAPMRRAFGEIDIRDSPRA